MTPTHYKNFISTIVFTNENALRVENDDRRTVFLDMSPSRKENLKYFKKLSDVIKCPGKSPLKTHDYLQDLPPAVDSIAVKKDRLSPYITKLVDNLDGGRFPETEKLVPHLGKHEDYVIHYQELQYYIKLGMVVDEITQVLSFDQDNWLAP
ncbi:uncharacterized protein OCT59_023303 [Rhizophagus irregularis]|uniref:uncharacterized protein n=1 Tax=Rhizophagus irregularis TaxID=588596 RepID=UPI00331A19FB|nr:hypothetical protein OCT59_023303 [Rhizophagus irregularis]